MLRLPEPGSFEHRVSWVACPTAQMWRLSRFPATEPFYGRSGTHRFDHPADQMDGTAYGVLYVAQDPETAFCESILHDSHLFRDGGFRVAASALAERSLVAFRHPGKKKLSLVDMTGAALKALGLNNDLCAGEDPSIPQQWSKAIHDSLPAADGIRYISRQRNDRHCFAIFERSGLLRDTWARLTAGDIVLLCDQFNVKAGA